MFYSNVIIFDNQPPVDPSVIDTVSYILAQNANGHIKEINDKFRAIHRNEAYCKECSVRVHSIFHDRIVSCKCGNVLATGGNKYIKHEYNDKSKYSNWSITWIKT